MKTTFHTHTIPSGFCHCCKHEWKTVIYNRTSNKSGCPNCSRNGRA
ncbi:zinc-ribbon domain-containing protein [Cytobacillus firmus]